VFAEDKHDEAVFHHEVKLIDRNTLKVFYDKLTYIYLEMPKFRKTEEELKTHFDKWLYVLRNLEDLTKRPAKLQEKIFAKLFEQAEIDVIDTAFDEGKAEGLAKGKAEGLAEGKAEGLAEGEKRKALETARKMREKGFSAEEICELTGLSLDDMQE